jgi:hypothetical protein
MIKRIDSIEDFRILDAIARKGNVTGAANEMNVTLTVISKRLRKLESALGVRLIHRTTRELPALPICPVLCVSWHCSDRDCSSRQGC